MSKNETYLEIVACELYIARKDREAEYVPPISELELEDWKTIRRPKLVAALEKLRYESDLKLKG